MSNDTIKKTEPIKGSKFTGTGPKDIPQKEKNEKIEKIDSQKQQK